MTFFTMCPSMVILLQIVIFFFVFGECVDQLSVSCLEYERNALLDFKTGLEDPRNQLASWNNGSRDCCQWWGIGCDKAGAVITVDFQNRYDRSWGISGEIRPSLAKLKSLRHLDLSYNYFLSIPIPKFFGSLKHLRYLNLSNAGFSGLVPPNIGNLSRLHYLNIESVYLVYVDDLEWITGMISLNHLVMTSVDLSRAGLDWFGIILNKLPSLTELHMSGCNLNGPFPSVSSVNSTTSLAVLDLSVNNFNSKIPDWLANISSLVSVDLSYGGLHGRIPLGLAELPNLQTLRLQSNTNLSASCSQFFRGRWKSIKVVDLSDNMLHGKLPTSIGNMTSLTYLDLSKNNVQGGIPGSIGKLCNLKRFHISDNKLNGFLPEFLEETHDSCHSKSPLPSLNRLYLNNNELNGILPDWLGQLRNLFELDLSSNLLHGPILKSLESLQNLSSFSLAKNRLNGTLPDSLGELSELSSFDVSFNQLTGNITEAHFLKLHKLESLFLSSNFLTLTVSSNWTPPFQVWYLHLGSCHLGPSFPTWLRSQNEVRDLDLSNASISSSIPDWFWEYPNLKSLNVSFNQLKGQLPNPFNIASFIVDLSSNQFDGPIPIPKKLKQLLDLSNNKLSGPIPENIGDSLQSMIFFSLSTNQIDGQIPNSIGKFRSSMNVLDLSNNKLIGKIPLSFGNLSKLVALDLSKNNLSGTIPDSLGQLSSLQTLHLSDNKLSGSIPSCFQYLSSLETLDLGNNRLAGNIPHWLGKGLENLRILKLRSNTFFGELPSSLSNLRSLQVLDLADNGLNGSIPASYGYFKGMIKVQKENFLLSYGDDYPKYYEERIVLIVSGQELQYTKILSLVVSLDFSANNLCGELPSNFTNLLGLLNLNLSNNHISGSIPEDISKLGQLLSLDLSSNRLLGTIPNSLSSLSFLGHLNLSNNDFSGKIPYSGQMTTFEASSFGGNQGLCGKPLDVKCPGDNPDDNGYLKDHNDDDNVIDKWFYLCVGLGFAAGLLVPFFIMAMKKSWSETYFSFVEIVVERIPFFEQRMRARQQWPRGLHH